MEKIKQEKRQPKKVVLVEKTKIKVNDIEITTMITGMDRLIEFKFMKSWAGLTKDDTDIYEEYKQTVQLRNRLVRALYRVDDSGEIKESKVASITEFVKITNA